MGRIHDFLIGNFLPAEARTKSDEDSTHTYDSFFLNNRLVETGFVNRRRHWPTSSVSTNYCGVDLVVDSTQSTTDYFSIAVYAPSVELVVLCFMAARSRRDDLTMLVS